MQLRLLAREQQGRSNRHLEGSFSSRSGDGGKGGWREVAIGKSDAASARKHDIAHWMRLGPSAVCQSFHFVFAIELVGIGKVLILTHCQDACAVQNLS